MSVSLVVRSLSLNAVTSQTKSLIVKYPKSQSGSKTLLLMSRTLAPPSPNRWFPVTFKLNLAKFKRLTTFAWLKIFSQIVIELVGACTLRER